MDHTKLHKPWPKMPPRYAIQTHFSSKGEQTQERVFMNESDPTESTCVSKGRDEIEERDVFGKTQRRDGRCMVPACWGMTPGCVRNQIWPLRLDEHAGVPISQEYASINAQTSTARRHCLHAHEEQSIAHIIRSGGLSILAFLKKSIIILYLLSNCPLEPV